MHESFAAVMVGGCVVCLRCGAVQGAVPPLLGPHCADNTGDVLRAGAVHGKGRETSCNIKLPHLTATSVGQARRLEERVVTERSSGSSESNESGKEEHLIIM